MCPREGFPKPLLTDHLPQMTDIDHQIRHKELQTGDMNQTHDRDKRGFKALVSTTKNHINPLGPMAHV